MIIFVFQGKGHFINVINLKIDITVTLLFFDKQQRETYPDCFNV